MAAAAAVAVLAAAGAGPAQGRPLCGSTTATAAPRHVLIVMLENHSYRQVIAGLPKATQERLLRH